MFPFAQITGPYLNLLLAGVAGLVLLSAALVAFFVVYQRRIFAQERARAEQARQHQRELLAAAVEVQETERARIASDLHDEIGSLLTATRLYLRQYQPERNAERNAEIIHQSLGIVDDMILNTRRISHDLLPPTLEKFGFQAAAEDLSERISGGGDTRVEFSTNVGERLPKKTDLGLYRALQELLNNTLKHAGAQRVEVALNTVPDGYRFDYRDDGQGVDLGSASAGLGLRNIESRLELLGGRPEFHSAPGRGFRVSVVFPTPAEAPA